MIKDTVMPAVLERPLNVRVRPLEWLSIQGLHYASTLNGGEFRVSRDWEGCWIWQERKPADARWGTSRRADTLAAAKQAANRHWRAAVLSLLDVAAPADQTAPSPNSDYPD